MSTGDTGPTGPQGLRGYDGVGYTGAQGPDGPEGPTGPAGAGVTGPTGPVGNNGAIGAQGPDGPSGAGVTGPTGPAGNNGAIGAQGPDGPAGAGVTGPTGPAGNNGAIGAQGPDGPAGDSVTGPTGPVGDVGAIGAQGPDGPAGDSVTGPTGPVGDVGAIGAQGPDGPAGDSVTGPTGPVGDVGAIGAQGPDGPAGDSVTGPTGPAGEAGLVGVQGIQGIQGAKGSVGFNGSGGPIGATGPFMGATGPKGNVGATGPAGTAGLNGNLSIPQLNMSNMGVTWVGKSLFQSLIRGAAMSSSGQYQTMTGENRLYVSNNYGASFTAAGVSSNWLFNAMSSCGQFQIGGTLVSGTSVVYSSTDFGVTWNVDTAVPSPAPNYFICGTVSNNAQCRTLADTAGRLFVSIDYGFTWEIKFSPSLLEPKLIVMSSSGLYQLAVYSGAGFYAISRDYGNTWTGVSTYSATEQFTYGCISSSGQYMTLVSRGTDPDYNGKIFVSYDFGYTWNQPASILTSTGTSVTGAWWYGVGCTSSGQYQYAVAGILSQAFVSTDYGNTWKGFVLPGQPSSYNNTFSVAISSTGLYSIIATNYDTYFTCNTTYPTLTLPSSSSALKTVMYDNSNNLLYYSQSSKTFVIDHPLDDSKHLVHACLEGPEAGVYYRGEGKIIDGISTFVALPAYAAALATDFTVHLTPIYDEEDGRQKRQLLSSRVKKNGFTVHGKNGTFYWSVFGKRLDISVEPDKDGVVVKGDGPYTWI